MFLVSTFTCQEIPCLLRSPMSHVRVYHSLLLVPVLIQMDQNPTFQHYFHFNVNIILPCTPMFSEWAPPFRIFNYILHPLLNSSCMLHAHLSHSSLFDHPSSIWWRIKLTELLIMQFFPACPVTSSFLLRMCSYALCSRKPSFCISSSMWAVEFHTCRTTVLNQRKYKRRQNEVRFSQPQSTVR
jgi:hypothetical protein